MNRYRPYFHYIKPYLAAFYGAMACAILYGLSSGFGISYVLERSLPRLFSREGPPLGDLRLALIASLIPMAFLLRGLSGFFNTYLINFVGLKVLRDMRSDLFSRLQELQLNYFRKNSTGELLSRLSADTQMVQQVVTTVANDIIKQPAVLLFALGFLVYSSVQNQEILFVLAAISVIPACVLPVRYIGKRLLKRAREQQDRLGNLTGVMSENLAGAREVRAFSLQRQQYEKFREHINALLGVQLKVVKYSFSVAPSIEFVTSIGIALAFVLAYKKGVSLEAFVTIMPVLYFSYDAIKKIGNIHNRIQAGSGAFQRLEEIFNEPVTIGDPPRPKPLGNVAGHVTFENVSFQYDEEPVLRDVSLDIPAKTRVAIVGPSGAGKSTLISLIPRFYDPTAGTIRIDGIPVNQTSLADLRRNIALVPQDSFLFRDTLENNIRLGRQEATFEEIREAARQAHIHDFIESLSQGYRTLAGERGSQLSGGQRQRIALARAFLRNAPILILDEATSSLDSESERKIQDALKKLVLNKTVFIVAHRFSTIKEADLILLFEAGRMVSSGNLDQLRQQETFKKLYENQLI